MKKCCFLIPYFGKLPNYFELFAKTCGYNKDYDWFIFTDDKTKYTLPDNVKIFLMGFEELKKIIQSKFDFNIFLDKPYKLCDYKPAYGYIFENYISNYKFWGHCDLDTIMGDLNKFITEDMLEKYDKIFCLGHMILYKNTYENNRVFMSKYDGRFLYKDVFQTDDICVFDETYGDKENINTIFLSQNKKVYMQDLSLNFNIGHTKFIKTTFNPNNYKFEDEKYKKALYIWKEGKIFRIYKENTKLKYEEFLYAHFQQRNMKIDQSIIDKNIFKFVPNKFMVLETEDINISNFDKIKKRILCFHTIEMHLKWKINKFKRWLGGNKK